MGNDLYLTKPDWEASRERFEAWWNRSCIDRVLIQVLSPAEVSRALPDDLPEPVDQRSRWLDIDRRIGLLERWLETQHWGGDAFPYLDTHIGPGTMSLYLGAQPNFQPNTVWYEPIVDDLQSQEPPEYDESNEYWVFSQKLAHEGVQRLEGRALVSFPDLIEGLDTLSSLIGNQKLLMELVDRPDAVHEWLEAITDVYFDYHDPLYNIIADSVGGSCFSAFQSWAPGPMAKVQCDFSAMISPEMFEQFVAPYLDEQCQRLEYSVFHLDGPCCLQHLDILLSIGALDAIQWTPGAGQPSACDASYIPIYKRIRAAGKSAMIRGGSPSQAKALVEALGTEGLDILFWADSYDQAQAVVADAMNWRKAT